MVVQDLILCMPDTVIYDGNCPFCRLAANTASKFLGLERLEFDSGDAQRLLEREFDDPGFTLYLFEEDTVYFGGEASRRIAERLGLPGFLAEYVSEHYLQLAGLLSVLTGRRRSVELPSCNGECRIHRGGGRKPRS